MRALVGASAPGVISLAAGTAALERFAADAFRELSSALLRRDPTTVVGLGPAEGQPALRRALARREDVRAEEVLILTGSQQGLDLVSRCLLDPGDTVLMDRPGYIGALQTFRAAGVHLVGWDLARADSGELEDLVVRYRPKLVYTNPSFQDPSGRVLPLEARRDLLELAARYRLPVIEDEPYRELFFDAPPPPSLRALDRHGVVISLGSFSKTLAPGPRLGWLVAVESIADQLALVKVRGDIFSPTLPQLVVAELLAGRAFDEHLRALRQEHRHRRDTLQAALRRHLPPGALSWPSPAGGLYPWCRLDPRLDSARLLQEAAAAGVSFVAGETFYPDGGGRHELRLCFTAAPPRELEEGARRLGALLANPAAQRRLADAALRPLV